MRKYFKHKYVKDRVIMLLVMVPLYVFLIFYCFSEHVPVIRPVIITVIEIPVVIWLVYTLVRSDKCIKNITDYCEESGYAMQDLEEDFASADILGHRIRCGSHWIYFMNEKGDPDVVEINEIESIEFHTETDLSGGSQDYIYCYRKNKEMVKIPSFKSHYKVLKAKMEKFNTVKFF